MNIVNQYDEKRNGFSEVAEFVTWLAGILTDFYFKELIEIGAKPAFPIWHWA